MATSIVLPLNNLPVEILHRIFDSLDAGTILFYVKCVCKRLYSATTNYNRYELNFNAICKKTFHQLCSVTDPENIISLTLSDENQTPGQIELFLSLYCIEQYTRLQSVTLMAIKELHLNTILKHISTAACSLTHLVIDCELHSVVSDETLLFLSLTIGKNTIRKLDLNLGYTAIHELEWPLNCSVIYLRLSSCIRFKKFCRILSCSPYIESLILRDCIIYDIEEINCLISANTMYHQVTSLSLDDCDLKMAMVESLLSLTPSLIHLTILGNSNDLFDGDRWEKFIQTKLLHLNKFQFTFQSNINVNHDLAGLESVIQSFRTPFWIETKQWFVTALSVQHLNVINLYTINDCASKINFRPNANKITRSTGSTKIEQEIMQTVREISLDINEMQVDLTEKTEKSAYCFYNRLTKLRLQIHENWPDGSLDLLSSFIDLSTITGLTLDVNIMENDSSNIAAGITALLQQASHIKSLVIISHTLSLHTICSIISHHIKHLQIPVTSIKDVTLILKQFDHLFSVSFTFRYKSIVSIKEITELLVTKGRDFTYHLTQFSLHLWLGMNKEEFLNSC
ncbi:unnamed protein product [Rotaria socialis]|uniref:F-box domain-containing protein n=1 Tax=Rotaria socialis TaxID=392032 RepID=A0A818W7M2_9BILA|nr:unnamed protein product [Rotaria socialis]CAF4838650.1 unnamed protein product [Rotaria socialis]